MDTYTKSGPLNTYAYQKRYMKELDVYVVLCEGLATNYDDIYIHSSIFMIVDWAGDSKVIAWKTYIYGLFKTKNDRKYIIPLKSWCGYSKRDTFGPYNQWYFAQRDCSKGTTEYMKTWKYIIN